MNDITSGSGGFNGPVLCLYDSPVNNCLYIGGSFTDYNGGSGGVFNKLAIYDYGGAVIYPLDGSAGYGFSGGDVFTICRESTTNFIAVGGNFTSVNISSGYVGIPYLFTFQTSNGYSISSYFSIGLTLSSEVNAIIAYSSGFLVGGAFSNTAGYSFCNTNYGFYMSWNGSNWELYDYSIYSPSNIILKIQNSGPYIFTLENGNNLRRDAVQMPTIPSGSWSCIAYNGSYVVYATTGQSALGFPFYTLLDAVGIVITSPNPINGYGFSGLYTILLNNVGSSFELIWRTATGNWYVISQEGCNFS